MRDLGETVRWVIEAGYPAERRDELLFIVARVDELVDSGSVPAGTRDDLLLEVARQENAARRQRVWWRRLARTLRAR